MCKRDKYQRLIRTCRYIIEVPKRSKARLLVKIKDFKVSMSDTQYLFKQYDYST